MNKYKIPKLGWHIHTWICSSAADLYHRLLVLIQWLVKPAKFCRVPDRSAVRTNVSGAWNVLSWSRGHGFRSQSGLNLECVVILSKLDINQKMLTEIVNLPRVSTRFYLLFSEKPSSTAMMWTAGSCHSSVQIVPSFQEHRDTTTRKENRGWYVHLLCSVAV